MINIQGLKSLYGGFDVAACTLEGCINPCCRLNWEGRVYCCNQFQQDQHCCGSLYHDAIHYNGGNGSEVFAHHLALQSFAADPSKSYYQWLEYYLKPWGGIPQNAVVTPSPATFPIAFQNFYPTVAPAPTQGGSLTITHSHPIH